MDIYKENDDQGKEIDPPLHITAVTREFQISEGVVKYSRFLRLNGKQTAREAAPGEVISTRDKTTVSEEFQELERDVELRRLGNWRLNVSSAGYQHALMKKKDSEALPDEKEKLLPIDALGIVMIQHGEEFGDESAYGMSLVGLGKAHCKLAMVQETFAMTFEDTFMASLVRTTEEINEYQKERKKLESRRSSYDSATVKLDKLKGSKKEKDRKEAEDEYERAKEKYEEAETDVYDRMVLIQENEVMQLREVTALLNLELAFAKQRVAVLTEVRQNWVDEETMTQLETTVRTHRSHRPPPPPPPPPVLSSQASEQTVSSLLRRDSVKEASSDSGSDAEDSKPSSSFRSRAKSFTRRKSDASAKATSRPPSRAEDKKKRSRADSNATATTLGDKNEDDDEEDREKDKDRTSKRKTMAGWASSKVSSIGLGIGRKDKERDREKFSALADDGNDESTDDEDDDRSRGDESSRSSPVKRSRSKSISRSKSASGTPNASPKILPRMLRRKSTSQNSSPHGSPLTTHPPIPSGKRKLVEAIHDFTASTNDELSFKTGDTLLVINEVLDDWWMGELQNGTGKKGIFPISFTRTIPQPSNSNSNPSFSMLAPGLTRRKSKSQKPEKLQEHLLGNSEDDSAFELSPMDLTPRVIGQQDSYGYNAPPAVASDTEDERHPFGDHHEAPAYQSPLGITSPPFVTPSRGSSYAESFDSSSTDHFNDEGASLMPSSSDSIDRLELTPFKPTFRRGSTGPLISAAPLLPRRPTEPLPVNGSSTPLSAGSPSLQPRKAPPPPPPRRPQSTSLHTPPLIPVRPAQLGGVRTNSSASVSSGSYGSNNSLVLVAKSSAPINTSSAGPLHLRVKDDELTYSPFDSPRERSTFDVGCRDFRQNPFKQKGYCSNCSQVHG
ncbi:hypothetical protein EUX98_g2452 [Antrodiella citrinella]|uniref:SH3 domain-containing protein n=1 Tax=Antrodiella citrinella TaxID=2447956 RepID=A0A4S4N1P7_9APHY|nr:hypothetical protein EUX98_g2452 [Antrodiella citrinella]